MLPWGRGEDQRFASVQKYPVVNVCVSCPGKNLAFDIAPEADVIHRTLCVGHRDSILLDNATRLLLA